MTHKRWMGWQAVYDGESHKMFDDDGQSTAICDSVVGAIKVGAEFWVVGGTLYFTKLRRLCEPASRPERAIAERPLPDTAYEALAWMRMVVSLHGGEE